MYYALCCPSLQATQCTHDMPFDIKQFTFRSCQMLESMLCYRILWHIMEYIALHVLSWPRGRFPAHMQPPTCKQALGPRGRGQ